MARVGSDFQFGLVITPRKSACKVHISVLIQDNKLYLRVDIDVFGTRGMGCFSGFPDLVANGLEKRVKVSILVVVVVLW